MILVRHPTAFEAVAALLGHADTRTTRKYYASEAAQAALRHVAAWLEAAAAEITEGDFDPSSWIVGPEDATDDARAVRRRPQRPSKGTARPRR